MPHKQVLAEACMPVNYMFALELDARTIPSRAHSNMPGLEIVTQEYIS